MPTRTARTAWNGTLEQGSGQVELTSSKLDTFEVSFPKRAAEEANGYTSPEELIAAAHSACYAMQLSALIAQAGPFDASVDRWFQSQLGLTSPVLTALTWLGDPRPVTFITALIALGCAWTRWWRGVALAVLAVPAASGLTEGILKPLIGRTIGGWLSLPSGHTTAVFSVATMGAILLSRTRAGRLLTVAAYLLAAAVAASMVAQGYHYFTDTIAGAGVGAGTVLTGALLIDGAAGRLRARRVTARRPVTEARSPGAGRR